MATNKTVAGTSATQVIIQSLTERGYDFNITREDGSKVTCSLPKKSAHPKNILLVPVADYELVKAIPTFVTLLELKHVRELPKVPGSFYSSNEQVAAAKAEAQDAKNQIVAKDQEIAARDAKIAELEAKLADLGGAK